jgi:outer membrane biosynthesis protein TonB
MTAAIAPSRGVGIAGTTLAHAALIAAALFAASNANRRGPATYEVKLVAAPLPSAGAAQSVTTPTPAPKAVAPAITPKPIKAPPKPVPVKSKAAEPAPKVKPANVPLPGVAPSTGQDAITRTEDGLKFPYPEYLARIENEIHKRWDQSGFRPGLHAAVAFIIMRDGSVPDASVVVEVKSGNTRFDASAMEAVDAAAGSKAFGPLPSGFNSASLSILFNFTMTPRVGN